MWWLPQTTSLKAKLLAQDPRYGVLICEVAGNADLLKEAALGPESLYLIFQAAQLQFGIFVEDDAVHIRSAPTIVRERGADREAGQ